MARSDLYSKGFVLTYEEGDTSLERDKIQYKSDTGDAIHVFIEGESLTMISYRYYGEPVYWYLIADINEIENPLFIEPGTQLIIPNKEKYLL